MCPGVARSPPKKFRGAAGGCGCPTLTSRPPPDHQGLPATDAGAAERPHRVSQLRAGSLCHPRRHRLLHVQSLGLRLHGEPDPGAAGLSGSQCNHRTALPHQHRDVPGHEGQVSEQGTRLPHHPWPRPAADRIRGTGHTRTERWQQEPFQKPIICGFGSRSRVSVCRAVGTLVL